jgi:hypothetical protein
MQRALRLSIVLTIAGMLPLINLYEVGYLLTSIVSQLAFPGGFGGYTITLDSLVADMSTTIAGLSTHLTEAAGGYWVVLAVVVTTLALTVLSQSARKMRSKMGTLAGFAIGPALAAVVFTILSSYHEWRDAFYALDPLKLAPAWHRLTEDWPWLRLSAPAVAALVVFAFRSAIMTLGSKITRQHR